MAIFALSLVVACSSENPESEVAGEDEDNQYESAEAEDIDKNDQDKTEDPVDSEEREDEGELSEESEEVEVTHYIAEDYTVRPLEEDGDEQVVLLTIDDAPEDHGVEMAETLKELDAGAIFFVNGHFLQSDEGKDQLTEIYELGFEIGNHTMNHPNLNDLSEEEQYNEIVELNDLVEEIIGERPNFFRAPFGANTDYSNQVLEDEGMVAMNWSYGYDFEPEYMEADPLADIMVETDLLRNGANLLMHDRSFTSEALEDIVIGLREKGYEPLDPARIETNYN